MRWNNLFLSISHISHGIVCKYATSNLWRPDGGTDRQQGVARHNYQNYLLATSFCLLSLFFSTVSMLTFGGKLIRLCWIRHHFGSTHSNFSLGSLSFVIWNRKKANVNRRANIYHSSFLTGKAGAQTFCLHSLSSLQIFTWTFYSSLLINNIKRTNRCQMFSIIDLI